MTSYVTPKKNSAFILFAGLYSQSAPQSLVATPTLAAGDFKVSIDGAATANLATLPTNTPAASGQIKISLSAAEMNGDNITITGIDAAGAEWSDIVINIQTSAQQIDDLATAAVVAGLGTAGGAAINTDATTDNAAGGISGVTSATTKIGTETNTYTSASAVNSVYHTITHAGDAIDWVYQFLTGGGTSPVGVVWTGYLTGSNDTITLSVWNHVGAAWESMATQSGQAGTTNAVKNIPLYARHEGTSAAELGKVYIRLHCTGQSSPVLNTDQLYVSYSVTSRSVGYALGAVWIDTDIGVAGTESFVNGVADNPVLTLADALTIATANRLRTFEVGNGSTLTLASTTANKVFDGHEWTLALGGQNIASSMFIDASVSGTGTGAAAEFETCDIGAVTLDPCFVHECSFGGTLTIGSAGDYYFYNCHSSVAGTSAPIIDMGAVGATNISLRRWSGGLTINNIASGDVISLDAVSGGTVTLNGADGNVQVRGMVNIVDNRTGSPTLGTTNNMDARFDALDTAVADLPTNAELATALGTADDATLAAIAALNNLSAAEVNAEVVDALATDTYAEPAQGTPLATTSLSAKIGYIYKFLRNRVTQTSTTFSVYNDDAVTVDHKATVADDGTTFDRTEIISGP